ncbi:odorant receptor 131-2-like [Rhinatrema bivittatum]|uniref:odorant receptor 131-2-like n=1 Tax=Rhinatrema bivittatum TaxID=194408 RepID=UPI00112C95B0|nr:odorant receptor 131-2-like [Rhinatrema bivittatum]
MQSQLLAKITYGGNLTGLQPNEYESTLTYLCMKGLATVFSALASCFLFSVVRRCPRIREKVRFILLACIMASETTCFCTLFIISAFGVFSWSISYLGCSFLRVLSNTTNNAELYGMAAMCLDRYLAVCHPLLYDAFCSSKNILRSVLFVCLAPLVVPCSLFLLQNFLLDSQTVLGLVDNCSFNHLEVYPWMTSVRLGLFSVQFLACFLIICTTYVLVVKEGIRAGAISSVNHRARRTILFHLVQLSLYILPIVMYLVYYSLLGTSPALFPILPHLQMANTVIFTLAQIINPVVFGLCAEEMKPFVPAVLRRGRQVVPRS